MANPNPAYPAPTWVNNSTPAINSTNLQAISDAVLQLQKDGIGRFQITVPAARWSGTYPSYSQTISNSTVRNYVKSNSQIFFSEGSSPQLMALECGASSVSISSRLTAQGIAFAVTIVGGCPFNDYTLDLVSIG